MKEIRSILVAVLGIGFCQAGMAVDSAPRPLPVARTPFEKVGKARQPVELKHFMYRAWNFGKFTDWAEYRSGDRSVMCAGDDERLKLAGGYGWGADRRCEFGRIGVYDEKFDVRIPGKFLVASVRLLTPGEKPDDKTDTNNDLMTVDRDAKTVKWERKIGDKTYSYDFVTPSDGVVEIRYDEGLNVTVTELIEGMRGIKVDHKPATSGKRGLITVDLGEASIAAEKALPMTTGIDHWANDAYDVPIQPTKNLQVNNGFEAGLRNWNNRTINNWQPSWDEEITKCGGSNLVSLCTNAHSGNYALAFLPGNLDWLDGVPMGARQGQIYTVSWYEKPYDPSVKESKGGVSFSQPGGSSWSHVFDYDKNIKPVFKNPDDQKRDENGWIRKAFSFKVLTGPGMRLGVGGNNLIIDDIQIEEGDTVTEYVGDPVSARIVSDKPYLYFRPGEKVSTKLVLSGDPSLSGKLDITVRNYYYETVIEKNVSFKLNDKGFFEQAIDLSKAIKDQGMYFVQYRYSAADKEWRDHSRFQVVEPLSNDHPTKKLFANFMYNRGAQADEQMRMMMELGWGATSWMNNEDFNQGESAKLYRKYKISPMLHSVGTEIRWLSKEMEAEYPDLAAEYKRSGNIRRDFGTNVNEKVCEYLRKVAYKAAMNAREDDVYWAFSGEEDDLGKTPERAANYAHYQKAVYEGLKKAWDERGVKFYYAPTHGTVGGDRWAAIPVLDNYIKAGKKIGLNYDFVGVHMAWSIDEPSIASYSDRQVNHEDLKAMLKANGMDNAPFFQAETFYLLQQYIPEWDSNEWCDNYGGGIPSQSLGLREYLHAALLARTFLIDLQSWPRALASHPWQRPYTLDRDLTLGLWPRVPNVLGRIFPEPKHIKHSKFNPVIRYSLFKQPDASKRGIAKPYMDGDYAVLAIWTHDHDVERGYRKGAVLKLKLPPDVKFVDLMGAERKAATPKNGYTEVPVTVAPLFVLSKDTAALEQAVDTCIAPEYHKEGGERIWPRPQQYVKVAKCGPDGPDWSKIESPKDREGIKFAWNDKAFFVHAESAGNTTFRIGFDGTGNARTTLLEGLGPDDQVYDFRGGDAYWTHEINTQYGHMSTGKPDAKEVSEKLDRKFTPKGNGGTWDLVLTERFASPVKMLNGVKFGFNYGFASGAAEPDLGDPTQWMMLEFCE